MTQEDYFGAVRRLTSLIRFAGLVVTSVFCRRIMPSIHGWFFRTFTCGAAVVHLRTLRPEYVREAFPKYKITYVSLVPLVF